MKRIGKSIKRIFTCILAACLIAGAMPAIGMEEIGAFFVQAAEGYVIDNGYIKVTVSEKNGGFGIRTVDGDKVNKDDDNKQLLFEYDDDNTSFTSFQVTKNGKTKEYIFGGKYAGSSKVSVAKENETLVAKWSVDDLTFIQTISLVNSGANEHGTAYISYTVENAGEPADVKCRMLMDTSLGEQDYAYYNLGNSNQLQEREVTLGIDGYNKTFYALDDAGYPSIVAYTINAAINDVECKPYQTTFAHWNNLASTVFDYTVDADMAFTNPYNKSYQTADSAYALYFDMGNVATNATSVVGTNYGIFSNETVKTEATVAVNMVAPDVLEFATDANGKEDQSQYADDGNFTVKTYIENFGSSSYSKVKVLVYTTGGIDPLNQSGNKTNSTYDNPYSIEIDEFSAKEKIEYEWSFAAEPKDVGQYAKIHYKVYDVSDEATQNTGTIMKENLLGEGETYILCPGSVSKIPAIKFTGTTPDTIYNAGIRTLYLTGDNFSMLANQSEYKLMLSRVDGSKFNGVDSVEIPADSIEIDTSTNRMTVILTDDTPGTLPTGMYELTVDYTDSSKEDITAPALRFQVSDSVKYRNDAYGFLAVIKTDDDEYYIKNYAKESDYIYDITTQAVDRDDVLLEFKGSFIKEKQQDGETSIVYKGLSINDSDNVMTLNDCLDIKNGTVTITEDEGSVTVDFDADIYTTGAGTSVWSGVCALTELEAGVEYALIEYDENGEREAVSAETIALLWPSVGQGFQELMGLLFEFKYGEFGTIKNDESNLNDQRVVAFGAALDLSFIIPESVNCKTTTTEMDNTWSLVMQESIDASPDLIRATNRRYKYNADTVNTKATTTTEITEGSDFVETGTAMGDDATAGDGDTRSASVQIDDILFGGEYIGINMSIALGIPGYIESMPGMQAILSVNTIGDWSFGASGVCEFSTFCMEASIQILSKDGIPIPDELTFFIGGFVPGINVDCYGILWLQGGGGGIQNLYDTIFLDSGIPPLKLLLEAQISLMQVISARASIGLSLRGVDASISNGVLVNALPVLNNASVSLQWYPDFYLEGAVNVSILDAIHGGGYIVVEHDGFFEFFIRAALQIPGSIPIIGGIQIADANLGANQDKIWGQIVVLDVCLGVTYYWGEEIDWNSGSPVYPTYPELVGMEGGFALASYPIGVDETTGDTLYMAVGTNLLETATAVAVDNNGDIAMYGGGSLVDELYTDVSGKSHRMFMASNGNSKFLTIEWTADSKEEALSQARLVTIKDTNATPHIITILDNTKTVEEQQGTNANLTYDEENKKASLAISFTKASAFDKVWEITTPEAATLVLYDVAPLPVLSEENTTVAVNDSQVSVTLNGSGIDKFTKVSFIAENENNATMVSCEEGTFANNDVVAFELPESLSSGTYSLRIIAKDDNDLYYSEITKDFTYTNPNQPSVPTISAVKGVGDYKQAVTMSTDGASDEFDGYVFDAYKYNAESQEYELVNGVNNILYYKDGTSLVYNDDGTVQACTANSTTEPFVIGGHYESKYTDPETNEVQTLIAGFSEGDYKLEVRRFKVVESGKALLYSNPYSKAVTVTKPVETKVNVNAVLTDGTTSKKVTLTLGDGTTYEQDYYNHNELALVLSSSTEKITGRWELDGGTREGTRGEITELTQQSTLYFADLEDGTHTLEFVGKNEYGDKTAVKYRFTVDTQGPRLMLEEPLNGSLFDYKTGKVVITGVTDKDAILTVIDNATDTKLIENAPMSTETTTPAGSVKIDGDGKFTTSVILDTSVLQHNLTIRVLDNLGNVTEKDVLVVSDGLGSIEKLMIYAGDEDVTNTKLTAGGNYLLRLMAKPKEYDTAIEINDSTLVEWTYIAVNGEAELVESADTVILKTGEASEGMVTARYLISDAGAYTVNSSFGDTGAEIIELNSSNTQIIVAGQCAYTSGAVTPTVTVFYNGTQLIEGVDYELSYSNNVNVSIGSSVKPQVIVTGLNAYKGSVTKTFEIVYMETESDEKDTSNTQYYSPTGIQGNNGYYTSDVTIVAKEGYELVNDKEEKLSSGITITEEGKHTVSFRTRRLADGALSDQITLEIRIDKSMPTGTIEMNEKTWDTFLSKITFGLYNVNNYAVTLTAADEASGVEKIEFVVSEKAYASIKELEADDLKWKTYSETFKPTLNPDKNQIIYVRLTDKAGNVSYISSDGIVVDTTAPTISNVYIKEDTGLAADSLEFRFTSDEAGTFYYAVVKASQKAPDAASIIAGTVENAIVGNGMIHPKMIGEEVSIVVTGLEENTLYVVYIVVEDNVIKADDGSTSANISEVISSTPASTKAPEDFDESDVPQDEPENGSKVGVYIAIIAVILLAGGFFIFFFVKKRKKKKDETAN